MGVAIFSPAKINLYLAVTGRRADGYHELVSVAAPLGFGDELEAESGERGPSFAKATEGRAGSQFSLECDRPGLPVDESNLVLKAARAFAVATGWTGGAHFKLTKRIPLGAGLGGGSSNAVAALRALNRLAGGPLAEARLAELAATLGSDCALFLAHAPVVMRGRGERLEALPGAAVRRLAGQRVLLFKPSFAISTAWAYGRMAARGSDYLPPAEAEARLGAWLGGGAPAGELLFNNMAAAAFEKFVALPVLLARLRREHGLVAGMSGSGSACFALLPADAATGTVTACIREAWGPAAFVQEARIV
jgi:4-diphosphocytidyl-2-C-methyl-D-erythritol kinase